MTPRLPFETLHAHTVYSDGILTHQDVLDLCEHHKIGIVAFTDHEALLDKEKFLELKSLSHPVRIISGIELTFNALKDIPGRRIPPTESGHIVGLFIDPTESNIADYCRRAQDKRREKVEHNIKELIRNGFSITMDEVSQEVKGLSYAKPHVVAALLRKESNRARLDELLESMNRESEHDEALRKRYERILTHDMTRRVYDLLLGNHPYVRISNAEIDDEVELDTVVSLIRGAGGVASIAHWFTVDGTIDTDMLRRLIAAKRIDGFETRYGFYDPPEMQEGLTKQMAHLTGLARELDCITTGGVDLHKPEDLRNLNNPDYIERTRSTIGMTELLLKKFPRLDKTWTTLE